MSVGIKNFRNGSPVNLYPITSDSELSSDEPNFGIRSSETDTLCVQQSPRTDCTVVDDSTHSRLQSSPEIPQNYVQHPSTSIPRTSRKRPRVLSSDEDSEPEATSRGASPEIPYQDSPAYYQLHESKGQFLIVKIPMSRQRTRMKKCSEQEIVDMMNTESDDEAIFESLKKSGATVVGTLAGRSSGAESSDRSRNKTPSRVARSCRSKSKDIVSEGQDAGSSGEDEEPKEKVSFRIKLRRSTEQSNYKVQTILEWDAGKRRSSRRSNAATPKRCSMGDCKEEDHSSKKKTRETPNTPTSSTVSRSRRNKPIWGSVNEEIDVPESIGSRVRRYSLTDWERDDREMVKRLEAGEILGPKKPRKIDENLEEAATPRSLRARRNSRQIHYSEHDFEDANGHLDKENQSENDPEEDSEDVSSRGQTRRRFSKLFIETPQKEKQIPEEPSTARKTPSRRTPSRRTPSRMTPSRRVLSDLEEDSDCVTPRGRTTRQHSLRSATKTPRQERAVSEEAATSRRTPRKSLIPDLERETTNCRTPRTSAMRKIEEETNTPTTPRGKRISRLAPNTPSVTRANLTPSMSRRTANVRKPMTRLGEARAKLHVSAVPKSLPCREQEFNDIYQFLERKLLDNNGGCIYISGVPGTGKTATVNEAIRCLKKLVAKGDLENFDFVEINGMKLSEPRQAYAQILKQIDGRSATWEGAYDILNTRFTRSSAKRPMMLLLVDELDLLCTKRQDVVYNLLDWPAKENARLVVITIANTMDLPERVLMGRVTSRLGLTRLTFQPYTHKQLQEIVMARLKDSDAFKSDAIEFVARKVGAVSGDARRALDICRRATEIAELGDEKIVSMKDVNQALTEMIASFKVQAIKHRSEMEKMFLRAVSAEVTRTGVEETNFDKVYLQLQSLCSFEGLEIPNVTQALGICGRLGASRLLLCEHSRSDIQQRILLNVSMDDLHFAMNINT